jgi:hypothetical protein
MENMSEKMKDLASGKEITLYELRDVSSLIGADNQILRNWVKDVKVKTPSAAWEFNGRLLWAEDSIKDWKELWDNHIQESLNQEYSKAKLIDLVIAEAVGVERFARYSYNRSRSYPVMEARQKVMNLQALWRFVADLGGAQVKPPKAKVDEYRELLKLAKSHLNME